jgi:hypothetical protein
MEFRQGLFLSQLIHMALKRGLVDRLPMYVRVNEPIFPSRNRSQLLLGVASLRPDLVAAIFPNVENNLPKEPN